MPFRTHLKYDFIIALLCVIVITLGVVLRDQGHTIVELRTQLSSDSIFREMEDAALLALIRARNECFRVAMGEFLDPEEECRNNHPGYFGGINVGDDRFKLRSLPFHLRERPGRDSM